MVEIKFPFTFGMRWIRLKSNRKEKHKTLMLFMNLTTVVLNVFLSFLFFLLSQIQGELILFVTMIMVMIFIMMIISIKWNEIFFLWLVYFVFFLHSSSSPLPFNTHRHRLFSPRVWASVFSDQIIWTWTFSWCEPHSPVLSWTWVILVFVHFSFVTSVSAVLIPVNYQEYWSSTSFTSWSFTFGNVLIQTSMVICHGELYHPNIFWTVVW